MSLFQIFQISKLNFTKAFTWTYLIVAGIIPGLVKSYISHCVKANTHIMLAAALLSWFKRCTS